MIREVIVGSKKIKTYGENVTIKDNRIEVDGVTIANNLTNGCNIVINGDVNCLDTDMSVSVNGNIKGPVDCKGDCSVEGDVYGDIDCSGSCTCESVNGDIDAGGIINVLESMTTARVTI